MDNFELYYKDGKGVESLKGTKTEENLNTALFGESRAYLKYKWYEQHAKRQGLMEIADIFAETAANENEHAEIWFRFLGGWGDTLRNLEDAAMGEHYEWASMYSDFAKTARDEGFEFLAGLFERVGAIEKTHEERYMRYHKAIENKTLLTSDTEETKWICLNCGNVVTAKDAPMKCSVCQAESGYFKKLKE